MVCVSSWPLVSVPLSYINGYRVCGVPVDPEQVLRSCS